MHWGAFRYCLEIMRIKVYCFSIKLKQKCFRDKVFVQIVQRIPHKFLLLRTTDVEKLGISVSSLEVTDNVGNFS